MISRLLIVGALAAALAACDGPTHEPILRIDTIEVTNELDLSRLDIEVHVFDEATRAHLGCAGAQEGLQGVDESDHRYLTHAFVRSDATGDGLDEDELFGRSIEVIVIEDDDMPCPVPPGADDDVVGLRGQLGLDVFATAPILTFDAVVALQLSVD